MFFSISVSAATPKEIDQTFTNYENRKGRGYGDELSQLIVLAQRIAQGRLQPGEMLRIEARNVFQAIANAPKDMFRLPKLLTALGPKRYAVFNELEGIIHTAPDLFSAFIPGVEVESLSFKYVYPLTAGRPVRPFDSTRDGRRKTYETSSSADSRWFPYITYQGGSTNLHEGPHLYGHPTRFEFYDKVREERIVVEGILLEITTDLSDYYLLREARTGDLILLSGWQGGQRIHGLFQPLPRSYLTEEQFRMTFPELGIVDAGILADVRSFGFTDRQAFLVDYGTHKEILVGKGRIEVPTRDLSDQRYRVRIETDKDVYFVLHRMVVAYSMRDVPANTSASDLMERILSAHQRQDSGPILTFGDEEIELNCKEWLE